MREGPWTFWDEAGREAAAGTYRGGRRHGNWTFFDAPDEPRVTYFIVGRETPDLPQQIVRLAEQLKSPDWRTRVEAIGALGEIGEEALPELIAVLKSNDPELVLRALRAIARLGTAGEAALPEVQRLANSGNQSTRVEGLFALFALDESSRDETFIRLLSPDNVSDEIACKELHERLGRLGFAALAPLDRALDNTDSDLRLGALDVLVYLAWPRPSEPVDSREFSWEPPFQQAPGYRAELQRILERAEHHSDPAISQAVGEMLDRLHRTEKK